MSDKHGELRLGLAEREITFTFGEPVDNIILPPEGAFRIGKKLIELAVKASDELLCGDMSISVDEDSLMIGFYGFNHHIIPEDAIDIGENLIKRANEVKKRGKK